MSCENWNDGWIGALYDELDAGERERMSRHLEGCAACRETLRELEDTRRLLGDSPPAVPSAPRVVVLRPRAAAKSPVWSFAAGIAAALVLFVGGVLTGTEVLRGDAERVVPGDGAVLTRAELDTVLEEQQRHVEAKLAAFDRRFSAPPADQPVETLLTRQEWDAEVRRLRRDQEVDQARMVEFLLGEINATEARAGTWIGETRDALRVVAMQGDPRFSEQ